MSLGEDLDLPGVRNHGFGRQQDRRLRIARVVVRQAVQAISRPECRLLAVETARAPECARVIALGLLRRISSSEDVLLKQSNWALLRRSWSR